MDLRTLVAAAAAGLATFLVVAAAVSELLLPVVAFSVLVGVPAGLVAGAAVAAVVLLAIGDRDRRRRRLALALSAFGVTLLAVFGVAVWVGRAGVTASLVAATLAGLLAGAAAYLRDRAASRATA
jgi:hypothetical protein